MFFSFVSVVMDGIQICSYHRTLPVDMPLAAMSNLPLPVRSTTAICPMPMRLSICSMCHVSVFQILWAIDVEGCAGTVVSGDDFQCVVAVYVATPQGMSAVEFVAD